MTARDEHGDVPLCVDCDGTLIETDLLHEGLLLLVKQSPASLVLPLWLLRGKAYFKRTVPILTVAQDRYHVPIDPLLAIFAASGVLALTRGRRGAASPEGGMRG